MRTSKLETWVFQMADRRLVSHQPLGKAYALRRAWQERQGSFEEYIVELARCMDDGLLRGVRLRDAEEVAEEFLSQQSRYTYVFTRELHAAERDTGYKTFMLSLSPSFLVEPFAKLLHFTDAVSTKCEVDADGRFTGARTLPKKAEALQFLRDSYGCGLVDSVAVGDTGSDMDMLKHVEYPIAFNPDDRLDAAVRAAGMTVATERKNVIRVVKPAHPGGRFHEVSLREVLPGSLAESLYARMDAIQQKIL